MTATRVPARARVLLIVGEPISERLAGPAIRAWEIARALTARHHHVTIASSRSVSREGEGFRVVEFRADNAEALVDECDVVVFQGGFYNSVPWLAVRPQVQVMDLYDPFHLEFLGRQHGFDRDQETRVVSELTKELNAQLARADLVLCANDRQRDLWIGQLAALGRVRPQNGTDDGTIDDLVRIAPFGVTGQPFEPTPGALRGKVEGIGADDFVLVWGGGIYDWFDPMTLIRAVDVARHEVPELRLFFMAKVHPNAMLDGHAVPDQAVALARELGILGTHVVFNEEWVPYDERAGYLAEADIGVTTHPAGLETRFSFRTRNLDYLWAGLPIITSAGDVFADLVERRGNGLTVPVGDVDALAAAIVRAARDTPAREAWAAASRELAAEMTWDRVLAPFLEFLDAPVRSEVPIWNMVEDPPPLPARTRRDDLVTFARLLREGGPRLVTERIRDRVRRDALRVVGRR
ncbi:glycosyltransferase family 4 protein [Curtobacterium sp. RHCJP20]|uniref:Glycosyltransferase family 4 protein n=1 Tax=Curtobacterium subtropicum TaxID=3055138 RepID=A0ABT7TH14_9MICO|nr:glycosyltransferase family 4 protein [Curtobacterium subtropicum]MDM7888841.1 glycosyltransferase family 4 protein [Curtobacterium subtropicum]